MWQRGVKYTFTLTAWFFLTLKHLDEKKINCFLASKVTNSQDQYAIDKYVTLGYFSCLRCSRSHSGRRVPMTYVVIFHWLWVDTNRDSHLFGDGRLEPVCIRKGQTKLL